MLNYKHPDCHMHNIIIFNEYMHKEVLTVYISMTMGCTSFLLLDKGTKAATPHICLERVAAAFLYN